jgi:hypothetical protein
MKLKWLLLSFVLILFVTTTGCDQSSPEENLNDLRRELSAERSRNQTLETTLMEYSDTINDLRLTIKDKEKIISDLEDSQLKTAPVLGNSLLDEALNVIDILKEQDVTTLNAFVSPDRGVRFTPYPYVDVDEDVVFYVGSDIHTLFSDNTEHLWGYFDGTGDPIEMTFSDYYLRFVYDADFANPDIIGINQVVSFGNTIQNVADAYPGDAFVEFHLTGMDPAYEGMDWRSLTLVFENDNGLWYLVGVIHGEWTI